jgi:hypothetical protein
MPSRSPAARARVRQQLLFVTLIAAVNVTVMTVSMIAINRGIEAVASTYALRAWWTSYAIAWPTAWVAIPRMRAIAARLVPLQDGGTAASNGAIGPASRP